MKIMLVRPGFSSYKLPVTGRKVLANEPFDCHGQELDLCFRLGYFTECKQDLPELDDEDVMEGIDIVESNDGLLRHVPKDWSGMNILIKLSGGIGDCIIAASVAAFLKHKECYVSMAVSPNAIKFIERINEVDDVLVITENNVKYENQFNIVLDLSDFMKANERQVVGCDFYVRAYACVGLKNVAIRKPTFGFSKEIINTKNVRAFLRTGKYVAIHPDPSAKQRAWNDDYWAEVIKYLTDHSLEVLVMGKTGGRFDHVSPLVTDCSSWTEEQQLYMMHICRFFVGVDSCFMHIAGCFGLDIIGILGFSNSDHCTGQYDHVRVVKGSKECKCERILLSKDCVAGYQCMQSIEPSDVIVRIEEKIYKKSQLEKKKKQREARKEVSKVLRIERVYQNQKVCFVFPWVVFGGGEVSMLTVAKELDQYFDLSVYSFDADVHISKSFDPELKKVFGDNYRLITNKDQKAGLFEDYDVVIWYGQNETIPVILNQMKHRPRSVRVSHTHFDDEGKDFVNKWKHVIDSSVAVSPLIDNKIEGLVERSYHIPNPIPCDLDPIKEVARKKKTIGFLGRLDENKNITWLIRNLKKFDCDLVVKGLESARIKIDDLKKTAKDEDVSHRIEWLQADRKIGEFFGKIDALVVVSKMEGLPMVVLEAGHYGVPVISTPVGALPLLFSKEIQFVECLSEGHPDIEKMALKIKEIRRQDGRALRAKVNQLCNAKRIGEEYRKVIREAFGFSFSKEVQLGNINLSRIHGVGDVIISTALIQRIREVFPLAEIEFETHPDCVQLIAQTFPDIYVANKSTQEGIDIPVVYRNCWERGEHVVTGMGAKESEIHLNLEPFKKSKRNKRKIGFIMKQNLSAKIRTKELPIEKWTELSEIFKKYNCYQLGSVHEDKVDFLNDARAGDLNGFIDSIRDMNYVITIDNSAVHIGKALDIPMLVLFGKSSQPEISSYDFHVNVQSTNKSKCTASIKAENFGESDCCNKISEGCVECMSDIEVEAIVKGFDELKIRIS